MTQQVPSAELSVEVAHLVSLLQDFDTAMLTTRKRAAGLHCRPMSIAAADDDGTLWFVTSLNTAKADEVSEDTRAMVTFQRPNQCVFLNGDIELVLDRQRLGTLWKEDYRKWCASKREPGPDPYFVLLRFTPREGEYWDITSVTGVKCVFENTAGVSEQRPKSSPASHR
jgi:general stress protein 26